MSKKQLFFSLKNLRISLEIIVFALIIIFFLDFTGTISNKFHLLEHLQFIPAIMAGSVAILVLLALLTLLFGRIYCSVICPMGILQDIIARISKKNKKRKQYSYSKPKNVLRWVIVIALLAAFCSSFTLLIGLLEPYSIFGRITSHIFRPLYFSANNLLEKIFTSFGTYFFYKTNIFFDLTSFLTAAISLAAIGFFAWRNGRTFCNTICPTGTILGFLSKFSFVKINFNKEKCNQCGVCAAKCKASCINFKEQKIDYSRCVDCFNCIAACNKNALVFGGKNQSQKTAAVDVGKRKFIATGLLTAISIPLLLAQSREFILKSGEKIRTRKTPLSPPGSQSHNRLLNKCTACHLCISKCPSHVLKPAFMEYGIGGMMQPVMTFEHGYCNYNCTNCSEVCPNGALVPLTKQKKHETQTGTVQFNREICVVVKNENNCGACSEHCPTQAVKMVPYKNGLTVPQIDAALCVGCGGCEFICPVRPYRAIFIEGNAVHQTAVIQNNENEKSTVITDFGF
jgi:ferredoxin